MTTRAGIGRRNFARLTCGHRVELPATALLLMRTHHRILGLKTTCPYCREFRALHETELPRTLGG